MKFIKTKKGMLAIGILFSVSILLSPSISDAWTWGGVFNSTVGAILKPVTGTLAFAADAAITGTLKLLLMFSGVMLAWAMATLDLATSSVLLDEVFFSDAAIAGLNTGWGLVRDFVNMFFILILVFLAIATILRINKFSDKRLLFFVIVAALLVNFSKPITIFIIDVSNLAMTFFIDNIHAANTSYSATLTHNMDFTKALDGKFNGKETMHYVGMMIGIIFKFILAVMMFVLAISLIIRIVALWVLIILSPLAFFGIAMPGTFLSTLKDGWVKKLVYWCFFGPILLFFLWIALVMVSAISTTITNSTEPSLSFQGMDFGEASTTFMVGAMKVTIPYVAAIYMLFYGYSLTKSMSAGVGSSVLGVMNKGQGFMSRWGKRGAAVAGTMATAGLGYVGYKNYQAAKQGLNERETGSPIALTKADREKAQKKRVAGYAGKTNQFEAGEVNDQMKDWDEKGAPTTKELKDSLKTGKRGVKEQAAALRLAKEGDIDSEAYRNSMAVLQNNPKLTQRFEQNAKKHNLNAKLEYDVEQQIAKARAQINGRDISPDQRKKIKTDTYSEALEGMSLAKIKDQDINFHKNPEFQKHMKGRVASGKESIENLRKLDMSGDKKEVWKDAGWFADTESLSPEQKRNARMNRDITPEQERDAMRDMNN